MVSDDKIKWSSYHNCRKSLKESCFSYMQRHTTKLACMSSHIQWITLQRIKAFLFQAHVISCLKFSSAAFCSSPLFLYCVKAAVFRCYLSLPHSFAYNLPRSLLFTFNASLPLPLQSRFWFTYTLTHSPPISLHPPPVCPLPALFFLHPVLLRSPLPSILPAHVSSKLPTRSWTNPSNWQRSHPLSWHELDSTLINGNGSAVTRPWKTSGICGSDCATWKDTFGANADMPY